ncbi:MAG TPA: OmpA family protein [Bacteroidia bacterium]|nr:OmpA family protein [Bacteroidia bacterium]
MKKPVLVSLFLIICFSLFAQQYSSCDSAAMVDTCFGPVYAIGAPDPTLAMKNTDGSRFESPHAAVWFVFTIPYDTILTFDIVPQNHTDDLDFLLFKDLNAGKVFKNCETCRDKDRSFCDKIASGGIIPVRSNLAHADISLKGMTGLSANAVDERELPGAHPAYSKALQVKKGERYYLVVDNYTRANGRFTLLLHFKYSVEVATSEEVPKQTLQPKEFFINVLDSATRKPVESKIKVTWVNNGRNKPIQNTSSHQPVTINKGERIDISCMAKGYLISQTSYQAKTDSDTGITILLSKIQAHGNMVFSGIQFVGDRADFLQSSFPTLNELVAFMVDNPEVKILIKGYVNDPGTYWGYKYDMELSEARAKAVFQYLQDGGVDKGRMTWKGFANNAMIYPHPTTQEEMQANRRVEVEIK